MCRTRHFGFVCLLAMGVLSSAGSVRLTFVPRSAHVSESNNAPYYYWSEAANWCDETGASRAPAEDDELLITAPLTKGFYAANSTAYVKEIRFTSTAGNTAISHAGFYLKEGGAGLVSEVPGGTRMMWTRLHVQGDVCMNVTSSFVITDNAYGRSATQPGRVIKDGPASIICGAAGANWLGATIRGGSFTLKSGGQVSGLNFHFDGQEKTAYLALSNDLALAGATLTGSADLPKTGHGVTDGGIGATLSITGRPSVAQSPFTGGFHGAANFRFAPDVTDASVTFARAISTSRGNLTVERGTVRFEDGASWTSLSRVSLAAEGRMFVSGDAQIATTHLIVNGAELPAGVYATNSVNGAIAVDWLRGGGAVCAGGVVRKHAAADYLREDGWYQFGNPAWSVSSEHATNWFANMSFPVFRQLYVPSDARVRFMGGVLFDEFPSAATYDWSACTGFALTTADAFGDSVIPVGSGCSFWFMPCSAIETNATGSVVRTLFPRTNIVARTLANDVALDGTWLVNVSTMSVIHSGKLTGSGKIDLHNYWETFTQTGDWAFEGVASLGQVGNDLRLMPRSVAGKGFDLCFGSGDTRYTPIVCSYQHAGTKAETLPIRRVRATGGGGISTTGNRWGPALNVLPGNRVAVGEMYSAGAADSQALHIFSDTTLNVASRVCTGQAEVVVATVPKASYFNVYNGVCLEITNLDAAVTLRYRSDASAANGSSLRLVGTSVAGSRLVADSPQALPKSISGWDRDVVITGCVWQLLADFDSWSACPRTIGPTDQIAPTGVVTVTWTAGTPTVGTHTILTYPSDSPLSDAAKWVFQLGAGRSQALHLVRTSTSLAVRVEEGFSALTYYVDSLAGDDTANGLAPETAWKTIGKVNALDLWPDETVLFRRGGLWRGSLRLKSGSLGHRVRYGAYGEGPLPIIQGSAAADGADAWSDQGNGIWMSAGTYSVDVGNIIFDNGVTNGWKKWSAEKLIRDYDFLYDRTDHHVYLKLTQNPGLRHASVELALKQHVVNHAQCHDVTVENLAVRYGAAHGFGGDSTRAVCIRNCDIYWIGGGAQGSEVKADGSITRYGNGIEFWDASADNVVVSNRLWQIYDAAITDQSSTGVHSNLVWAYNQIWDAEYGYEHFNRSVTEGVYDVLVAHNTIVDSGFGWGSVQRPDPNGAPLMIWHSSGPVANVIFRDNIFSGGSCQGMRMTSDWHTRVIFRNNIWFMADEAKLARIVNTWYDFAGLRNLGLAEGSAFADPKFWCAAAHDYRLRKHSPAQDAATDGTCIGCFLEASPFCFVMFFK